MHALSSAANEMRNSSNVVFLEVDQWRIHFIVSFRMLDPFGFSFYRNVSHRLVRTITIVSIP